MTPAPGGPNRAEPTSADDDSADDDDSVPDDDSVLDDVVEVVDVVLGRDVAPDEPENRWGRRQRILDSWTAIILAVAAVATAWASFQASQWSERQADAQASSAILRADAGRAQTAATQQTIIDSQRWLQWVNAVDAGQKARADFLDNRFSPALKVAQAEWLAGVIAVLLALVLFFREHRDEVQRAQAPGAAHGARAGVARRQPGADGPAGHPALSARHDLAAQPLGPGRALDVWWSA